MKAGDGSVCISKCDRIKRARGFMFSRCESVNTYAAGCVDLDFHLQKKSPSQHLRHYVFLKIILLQMLFPNEAMQFAPVSPSICFLLLL